jgi:hypothetical protein
MYGVFVLDCNHACHPEIHPYEWLWWLKLTPLEKTRGNFNKTWLLGLFRESSNRFILWSQRPRVGTISIPFIIRTSETKSYLKFSTLVPGRFRPRGIKMMKGIPEHTSRFDFSDATLDLQIGQGRIFPLHLLNTTPAKTSALRWWISDLQTDPSGEWVWGYYNIIVSVGNGYTAKLESISAQ